MAAIDIRALRWTNLFRDIPQYPDLLTQRHWDSNKGKIAKMAGHTGIGDQMKATAAAFKKLEGKWVFIQGTRPVDVEKEKDDAISFMKSAPIKNFHEELKKLRDLATKTRDRFKKNKLIPKSAGKLCDQIREASDTLYVVTGTNTLTGHLTTAIDEHKAKLIEKQKKQAGNVVKFCKTLPGKITKAVADWRRLLSGFANDPEKLEKARPTLKSNMYSRARDLTQSIANFAKCEKAGVEWENYDTRGIQALAKTLVPYANGSGVDLSGLSAQEIERHVKVIEDGGIEFARLTRNVKIKGT